MRLGLTHPVGLGNITRKGGQHARETAHAAIRRQSDERLRKDLAALTQVFANLNARPDVWHSAFQELSMDIDTSPFLVEYIRKGEAKGAVALREVLHGTLEQCVAGDIPEDVCQRIAAQEELNVLKGWCKGALHCSTWDEVRALLGLSVEN